MVTKEHVKSLNLRPNDVVEIMSRTYTPRGDQLYYFSGFGMQDGEKGMFVREAKFISVDFLPFYMIDSIRKFVPAGGR